MNLRRGGESRIAEYLFCLEIFSYLEFKDEHERATGALFVSGCVRSFLSFLFCVQDWETVVIRKKPLNNAQLKDEAAVNQVSIFFEHCPYSCLLDIVLDSISWLHRQEDLVLQ
jgi:hypothetical protein